MPRFIPLLQFLTLPLLVCAQPPAADTTAVLSFTRSISIPLNGLKLYDEALQAWTWTFGQEPGAVLLRHDRELGVIEGTARVNYRSEMLNNRERTMGTITYRVIIHIRPGECRTVVTELKHRGNANAPGGGLHFGLLTRADMPLKKVGSMGRGNVAEVYAEIKDVSILRIQQVMQAFDARVRMNARP